MTGISFYRHDSVRSERPDCRNHRLSDVQKTTISLSYELKNLRDSHLVFSGDFNLNHSDILTLINYVSTV